MHARFSSTVVVTAVLLAGVAALPAHAQQDGIRTQDSAPEQGDFVANDNAQVQQRGGIYFVTGGVGDEELAALRAMEKDFSLRVLSTHKNGEFVGAYTIQISDKDGTALFKGEGQGPLFMFKLAPGTYTVEEVHSHEGEPSQTQTQNVTIPAAGSRELKFSW